MEDTRDIIPPVGCYFFMVEAYFCDFRGKATPTMMMTFLLDSATKHAEERGFGYAVMYSQGKAWVLTKLKMFVHRYPESDQRISVRTWITTFNRLFCERHWLVEDAEGNILASASSYWAVIDIQTRRANNILDLKGEYWSTYQSEIDIPRVTRLVWPKGGQELSAAQVEVSYSDIDINRHFNSIKFVEHLLNIYPLERYESHEVMELDINYLSEAYYGDILEVKQVNISSEEDMMSYVKGDKLLCLVKVKWRSNK